MTSPDDPLAPFRAAASPEQRWRAMVLEAAGRLDGETRAALERAAAMVTTRQEARVALVAAGLSALNLDLAQIECTPLDEAPVELTPDRLDDLDRVAREAAERASKATAGPWRAERGCVLPPADAERGPVKALLDPEILVAAGTARECAANSAFIAAAREDVPMLSAALQAATAETRRLRAREARLTQERDALGQAIVDAALRSGIYSGKPVTGPEAILLVREMGEVIRRADERVEAEPVEPPPAEDVHCGACGATVVEPCEEVQYLRATLADVARQIAALTTDDVVEARSLTALRNRLEKQLVEALAGPPPEDQP